MDEITKAAGYTASSFDNADDVKKSIDMWLHDANIPCDSAAVAEVMTKAVAECGANKKNNYFVFFCWLMKYLSIRPHTLLYIGSATLKELYFLLMMQAAGVNITLVSYGLDKEYVKLLFKDRITVKSGRNNAPLQIDFSRIDLKKEAQIAEMKAEGERVSGLVKRLSTTAAGICWVTTTMMFTRICSLSLRRVLRGLKNSLSSLKNL